MCEYDINVYIKPVCSIVHLYLHVYITTVKKILNIFC